MPFHLVPENDLRNYCRQRLEACEYWLRRLIHDTLVAQFGKHYITQSVHEEQPLFNKSLREHVDSRLLSVHHSTPPLREVDTLMLGQLCDVLCKDTLFKKHFFNAIRHEFPSGKEHFRSVMSKLTPIRNALSHANPISNHDAERALCYCSDIIKSISKHYELIEMNKEYNAPSIIRYSDSEGRVRHLKETDTQLNFMKDTPFRSGDGIRLEIEVDSCFLPNEYTIRWEVEKKYGQEEGYGNKFSMTLQPNHVSTNFVIFVFVTSNKSWHRHGTHDSRLVLVYRVLPPLE